MATATLVVASTDAAMAASLARQFGALGWAVTAASSADEAVRRCTELQPELVLIDATVGGLSLLERLRRGRATRGVKVALMGTEPSPELRARCAAAGAFVYVAMPLQAPGLLALQRLVLERRELPRVLISDDDERIARVLERGAREQGLEPVVETDATHVVETAQQVRPRVIVLDIDQGDFDGRAVLAALKADPVTRDIRVVMLTGMEDQPTRHDCLILGADDYVVKPIDPLFFVRIARKLAEEQVPS